MNVFRDTEVQNPIRTAERSMELNAGVDVSLGEKTLLPNSRPGGDSSTKSEDDENAAKSPLFATTLLFNDFHRDLIHFVAFDFHGRRMATVSSDSMICIWEIGTNGAVTKSACWKVGFLKYL